VRPPPPVLLACALRTLTPVTSYFVNPRRPRLFGKPFIVRVLPGVTTGAALYAAVWRHLRPFFTAVPRGKGGGGAGDERMGGGGSGVSVSGGGGMGGVGGGAGGEAYPFEIRALQSLATDDPDGELLLPATHERLDLSSAVACLIDVAVAVRTHGSHRTRTLSTACVPSSHCGVCITLWGGAGAHLLERATLQLCARARERDTDAA
jgi:hypothetical protein